jgi:hypothetical protein
MSEVRKGTSRNTENENKRCKIFNKVLNLNWDYVRVKKKQKENKNITKQRVCETISIIKMLTISKNLVWPRDLESFKGGNFNTLSLVDCYVQICYNYEFGLSLCKIVRSSVILLLPLFNITCSNESQYTCFIVGYGCR